MSEQDRSKSMAYFNIHLNVKFPQLDVSEFDAAFDDCWSAVCAADDKELDDILSSLDSVGYKIGYFKNAACNQQYAPTYRPAEDHLKEILNAITDGAQQMSKMQGIAPRKNKKPISTLPRAEDDDQILSRRMLDFLNQREKGSI
ncbi:hypothetical protein [Sphingomonas sp. R1]|uniref:hypothetical protein n=1 Tax=Sphingomonas sp. R1 TaxID=399176 RepID=UPI002223FCD1|nr:hypothetical protein [Sphingomonas sp. R1]UYY78420.1 hypothetical protein OIM94_05305 [Sphingomonas sp. R1]